MNDMSKKQIDDWNKKLYIWRYDIPTFAKEALGIGLCDCACVLDHQQVGIFIDVVRLVKAREKRASGGKLTEEEQDLCNKFGISVKSGKGVGKTASLAIVLIWFTFCYGENVKNLVTAPKKDQLKDNLFGEISKWLGHARRVFGENCLVDKVLGIQSLKLFRKIFPNPELIGKTCWTVGRTCSKSADEATQQGTLQGYHDKYMCIGADESFSVPAPVFVPVETTMTDEVNFMFLIGNPTKTSGYAYDTFHEHKNMWITRTINAEESTRISVDHINRLKEKYKDYPNMYRVNVLGEFPLSEKDALIPFESIMEAVHRYEMWTEEGWDKTNVSDHPIASGWDIGGGGDLSVGIRKQGMKVDIIDTLNERDTRVTSRWLCRMCDMHEPEFIGIDGIALGQGVYDSVLEYGYDATFVDSRKQSSDNRRYKNLRAELYHKLAQLFIRGEIAIPNHDKLIGELSVLKLVNSDSDSTKIQIMSKKDMKKAGIESPNFADALMMCLYYNNYSLTRKKRSNTLRALLADDSWAGGGNSWMGV